MVTCPKCNRSLPDWAQTRQLHFFCALQILFGLLGLAASLFTVVILGPFTFLLMALNVFNILTAGLMIYLIGETDRGVNF